MRSIFSQEDYYLFFDVFAQAKFKQKTWFGWFSSRDAQEVSLKINQATMGLSDRKFKMFIPSDQAKNVISEIQNLLTNTRNKGAVFLASEYNDNGTATVYYPNKYDIASIANSYIKNVNIFGRKSIVSNVNIDLEGIFGDKPKKVFIVNILGNPLQLTNTNLFNIVHNWYKDYIKRQNGGREEPVGVVMMREYANWNGGINKEAEIVSYSFVNEKVTVYRQVIARKTFKIPKQFRLGEALFGYAHSETNSTFSFRPTFTWKVPNKYEVDIEAAALYNGRWGGSKFKIVKN